MPALRAAEFDAYCKKSPPQPGQIFVFMGEDTAARGACVAQLAHVLGIDRADPFSFVRLAASDMDADESRFADEINSISMFGGTRLVHAAPTPRQAPALLKLAQSFARQDTILVLDVSDSIDIPESGADLVLVACASESRHDMSRRIRKTLEHGGFSAPDEAVDALIELADGDRQTLEHEMFKAMALAKDSGDILQAIAILAASRSNAAMDKLAGFVAAGDLRAFATMIDNAALQDLDLNQALMKLQWQTASQFKGKVNRWSNASHAPLSEDELRNLLRNLSRAVLQTRQDQLQAQMLAERAMLSATMASARKKR